MVNLLFYGGAFWLACIVFTVDLLVPASVPVGLGYTIVVLVGIWSPSGKYFFWSALLGTILIIFGYLVSPITGEPWKAMTHRMLSVVTLWGLAFFLSRRKSAGS